MQNGMSLSRYHHRFAADGVAIATAKHGIGFDRVQSRGCDRGSHKRGKDRSFFDSRPISVGRASGSTGLLNKNFF